MCRSLHGIFAFRVTGNDLKCLSFWPRDLNMCIHECSKFIYSEKQSCFSSHPGWWHVQSHLLSCCGWKEPAGQSCSAATVPDYSRWPLLPALPNMGSCTESKYCVSVWLIPKFRVNMDKVSSPLIENLIPDLRRPRGAFVRSGCQPAYTWAHHNPPKSSSWAYWFASLTPHYQCPNISLIGI